MPDPKRIVVTGGTGFVGSCLIHSLSDVYDIIAIVRRAPRKKIKNVRYLLADLSKNQRTSLLSDGVHTVIHLAQSDNYRDFPDGAVDMFRVNVESTARLLEEARKSGVQKFIYFSTGGMYQFEQDLYMRNHKLKDAGRFDYYWGTNVCGEVLARSYTGMMDVMICRPFFIYGPGQQKQMFIPSLVERITQGIPVDLTGENGDSFNPVYISDVVEFLRLSMSRKGSRQVDLSGPDVLSLRQIAQSIGKALGMNPIFSQQEGVSKDYRGDSQYMKEVLDRPLTLFSEGVRDLIHSLDINVNKG